MKKPDISGIIKNVQKATVIHLPGILTGVGIAAGGTAVGFAVWGTYKSVRAIDKKKEELHTEKLSAKDTALTVWKYYIPTVVSEGVSAACLICACKESSRRNAALAAAYSLSETALKEYRAKVVETIGEKKETAIRDELAKDRMKQDSVYSNQVIITGKGATLCYDTISGRYFMYDIEKLRRVENELNRRLISEYYISLNEFYDELGLDHLKLGDDLGWNINQDGPITLRFSSQLAEDGRPCLVVDYLVAPRYGYGDLH